MKNDIRHYGVLGMHWGVRRSRKEAKGVMRESIKKANGDRKATKAAKATYKQTMKTAKADLVKNHSIGKKIATNILETVGVQLIGGSIAGKLIANGHSSAGKAVMLGVEAITIGNIVRGAKDLHK